MCTAEEAIESMKAKGRLPDVIVAFNAGVWGYPAWHPGIEAIIRTRVPCLITSYTLEEAEDDEDHIQSIAASSKDGSETLAI